MDVEQPDCVLAAVAGELAVGAVDHDPGWLPKSGKERRAGRRRDPLDPVLPAAASMAYARRSPLDPVEPKEEGEMAWVQIQRAQESTWQDYQRVAEAVGDGPIAGLVYHAAGERDGRWIAVTVWESREAEERFRETGLMPAVGTTLGQESAEGGPPADEWFEVQATREP